MNTGRGQTEHKVACPESWSWQQGPALGGADREAGDVKIAGSVKAGHLRRLSADQCAAGLRAPLGDALNDYGRDFVVELPGCKIVQEKQWLGTLNDNVVDAHGHQVDSDRIVYAAFNRNFQLCADAVAGGDQDWVDEARRLEVEKSAESAKLRSGSWTARSASQWPYPVNQPVPDIDVDPRIGVG